MRFRVRVRFCFACLLACSTSSAALRRSSGSAGAAAFHPDCTAGTARRGCRPTRGVRPTEGREARRPSSGPPASSRTGREAALPTAPISPLPRPVSVAAPLRRAVAPGDAVLPRAHAGVPDRAGGGGAPARARRGRGGQQRRRRRRREHERTAPRLAARQRGVAARLAARRRGARGARRGAPGVLLSRARCDACAADPRAARHPAPQAFSQALRTSLLALCAQLEVEARSVAVTHIELQARRSLFAAPGACRASHQALTPAAAGVAARV